MDDRQVVARQLGREPRGSWRVAERCQHGSPLVIATAPLADGRPFPTLYYLSCPHLVEAVSALESSGECERWRTLLSADEGLRLQLAFADDRYRAARAAEGGGTDPTPAVGIAGERDPFGVKCLHAHVAAFLAGIGDPIGQAVYGMVEGECADDRCGEGR